jgi:hypothetical protein
MKMIFKMDRYFSIVLRLRKIINFKYPILKKFQKAELFKGELNSTMEEIGELYASITLTKPQLMYFVDQYILLGDL